MLIRVAKSAFILRSATTGMTAWELFRLRAIGFGLCTGPEVHLAGWAAAAVLGIPTVNSPPGITTALRPGSAHRGADRTPFGWTRCGFLPPSHRTIRHRVATVDNCFAVVDIARHHGGVAGLVAADAVLRSGQTRKSLARLTEEMSAYPGIQTARWVVEHGDGRAESPLESLGRMAFLAGGRDAPLSNVWIRAGARMYRVDHFLPSEGVVIEADGAVKYRNRPDADLIIDAEKDRERDLRALGLEVVRYTYEVAVRRPAELLRRVDMAARSRGRKPVPDCWSLGREDQSAHFRPVVPANGKVDPRRRS